MLSLWFFLPSLFICRLFIFLTLTILFLLLLLFPLLLLFLLLFFALWMLLLKLIFLYLFTLFLVLWRVQRLVFIIMCWTTTNSKIWKGFLILCFLSLLLQTFPLIPSGGYASPILDIFIKISFIGMTTRIVSGGDSWVCNCSSLLGRPFSKFMASLLEHFIEHTHGF